MTSQVTSCLSFHMFSLSGGRRKGVRQKKHVFTFHIFSPFFAIILVPILDPKDRHLVRQGSALAHWAAGAVKANAERQLERILNPPPNKRMVIGGFYIYCLYIYIYICTFSTWFRLIHLKHLANFVGVADLSHQLSSRSCYAALQPW